MSALTELNRVERERLLALSGDGGMYAQPVFGEGPERPLLLLVGEAPGAEETRASHPFVGKAGRQLDALLVSAGISRGETYITNAVKYRPVTVTARSMRNRTPDRSEVLDALPLLRGEIACLRPAVVATLGNVPLFAVLTICGERGASIGGTHGRALAMCAQGMPFTLFPLYHPASVLYNPALRAVCEADIAALGAFCRAHAAGR